LPGVAPGAAQDLLGDLVSSLAEHLDEDEPGLAGDAARDQRRVANLADHVFHEFAQIVQSLRSTCLEAPRGIRIAVVSVSRRASSSTANYRYRIQQFTG
jgi:hypothetical protein